MIKTILKLVIEVLGKRAIKAGLEETLLKNQTYITAAKQGWNIVEENFRITKTIEEKIASKADAFDKMLLAKFPELSQSDVAELRQAIAGEVNADKTEVLSQVDALKQLQDENAKLKADNLVLNTKISQIQSTVTVPQQAVQA
jgi:predicted metal-dependent phosphoesterase TrpH